jgi:HPr kinase/phosphorylase
MVRQKPACFVVSSGTVCREFLDKAAAAAITVLKTGRVSRMASLLASKLTPQISLHGVLVQIFGLGTLIIGESAIGKSEAALDLVLRGHKLAADDMVVLEKTDGEISGRATDIGADLLQIRGLGIINIRALYGESATVDSSRIGLVVELEEWKRGHHYSLVGLRERRYKLLGVNLPYLRLPVKTGRNMATLIEVAARNQMLKNKGIYTARELNKKLKKRLAG